MLLSKGSMKLHSLALSPFVLALSVGLAFLLSRLAVRWRARRQKRSGQAARGDESRQVRRARERRGK